MPKHQYALGPIAALERLFPPLGIADPTLNFHTYADVIAHYTKMSIKADGIYDNANVTVTDNGSEYIVTLEGPVNYEDFVTFAARHVEILDEDHAQKAIKGEELLKELRVWNPMKGYHVNHNPGDGTEKWTLMPPLGLNVMGQKGLLLMHYPPWAIPYAGTFDNAMTMERWTQVLECAGIAEDNVSKYKTIIDINPIAAPGSGESEYPNDYFPIMMAAGFFDGPPDRDYIKSMLELYLTPPDWPKERKYTLPLLICGSPLYDPQAPGWFRTAYTEILPQDPKGVPQVNVMQVGKFKVYPDSERETPYFIANHMIAAGVTGKCTNDPSAIPDIRQYEAQDLVAATILKLYADDPDIEPEIAKAQACLRWYGNTTGVGAPYPPDVNDRLKLCALAQMDLFFEGLPKPHPKYTYGEALARCAEVGVQENPCFARIAPPYENK